MGGVVSLGVSLKDRIRASLSSCESSRRSRTSTRSIARGSRAESASVSGIQVQVVGDANVALPPEVGVSGPLGEPKAVHVDLVQPSAAAELAGRRVKPARGYGTPWMVVSSKFVLAQVVFNMIASAGFPTLCFWFLFGFLGEGPYEWWEGPCSGVVIGSMLTSPLLIMTLAPAGMPEAVDQGWFKQEPHYNRSAPLPPPDPRRYWLSYSTLTTPPVPPDPASTVAAHPPLCCRSALATARAGGSRSSPSSSRRPAGGPAPTATWPLVLSSL